MVLTYSTLPLFACNKPDIYAISGKRIISTYNTLPLFAYYIESYIMQKVAREVAYGR